MTAGNHVIFASRILVDLVLLAASLQAISITQRTKKLRDMFYVDQTIDQLDPFIEPAAFRKMIRHSADGFELIDAEAAAFPRYNEDRLERLKQRGDKDELGFVAARLLERYMRKAGRKISFWSKRSARDQAARSVTSSSTSSATLRQCVSAR